MSQRQRLSAIPARYLFVFERQVVMLAAGQISATVIAEDECRMRRFR